MQDDKRRRATAQGTTTHGATTHGAMAWTQWRRAQGGRHGEALEVVVSSAAAAMVVTVMDSDGVV